MGQTVLFNFRMDAQVKADMEKFRGSFETSHRT